MAEPERTRKKTLTDEIQDLARDEVGLGGDRLATLSQRTHDVEELAADGLRLAGLRRIELEDLEALGFVEVLYNRACERLEELEVEFAGPEGVKTLTNRAHKAACRAYNLVTEAPKRIKQVAGMMLADYKSRAARQLEVEAKEREREARELVEREALEQAEALEAAGDLEGADQALETVAPAPPVVAAPAPAIAGLETFEHWDVREVGLPSALDTWLDVVAEFCRRVAASPGVEREPFSPDTQRFIAAELRTVLGVEPRYLVPDMKSLRAIAKAEKDAARVAKLCGPAVVAFKEDRPRRAKR